MRRQGRTHGLSHRLWWLAALMGVVVGAGIVLETPPPTGEAATAPTPVPVHAAHDARAARGS